MYEYPLFTVHISAVYPPPKYELAVYHPYVRCLSPLPMCPLFRKGDRQPSAIYHPICPLFITPNSVSCVSPVCPLFTTPTHVSTVQEGRLPAIHPAKTNYRLQAHYKLITSCWPCNTTQGVLQGLRKALRGCVLRYEARYEARFSLRIPFS